MGQINTNTTYKAFSPKWVSVDVGLQIGLGGVNITLTGEGSNFGRREGSARCLGDASRVYRATMCAQHWSLEG